MKRRTPALLRAGADALNPLTVIAGQPGLSDCISPLASSGRSVMDSQHTSWAALLEQATSEPGIISQSYRTFTDYSLGNCLLAWSQAMEREIPLGPIATYAKWRALGR